MPRTEKVYFNKPLYDAHLSFTTTRETRQAIHDLAYAQSRTVSQILRLAVGAYLDDEAQTPADAS